MESEGQISSLFAFSWEDSETCSSQCLKVSHWGWALVVHNTPFGFPLFLVTLPPSISYFSCYYPLNKLPALKSCFKYTSRGTQLKEWHVQNSAKNENEATTIVQTKAYTSHVQRQYILFTMARNNRNIEEIGRKTII